MLANRIYHLSCAVFGERGTQGLGHLMHCISAGSMPLSSHKKMKAIQARLKDSPLDANLHFDLAGAAFAAGRFHLAVGEARTARALGYKGDISSLLHNAERALPNRDGLNHNQWFRFNVLHRAIQRLAGQRTNYSLMDVGGGDGKLVQWLPPETDYVLVEPMVNGISGVSLPFEDNSFDIVVACHVLEHVPIPERTAFLEQLTSKARLGVILLNPFQVDGLDEASRLDLLIDITGADWAKEHRECTLPDLNSVRNFAKANGFDCSVEASGTLTTSLALVLYDHFAEGKATTNERFSINQFFNQLEESVLNSTAYPTAYLINITK